MIHFPPKTVLVAVDLSPESLLAWGHAKFLRRRFGCAIEAVYIDTIESISAWDDMPRPAPMARTKIAAAVRRRIGAKEKVVIVHGDPVLSLGRIALARGAELIVIGPHSRTLIQQASQSSLTEMLIRQSPVPVLAVRGLPRAIQGVLAPVSEKEYAQAGLPFAAAVAAGLAVKLRVLRVEPRPKSASTSASLDNLIRRLPERIRRICRPKMELRYGRAEAEILKAVSNRDLIVLTAHRKRLLQELFRGMTAVEILRRASVPVLIMPEPRGRFMTTRWDERRLVRAG